VTGRTRPFEDLTPRGQLLRVRGLALEALRSYDLEVIRCAFVARAFNTVFRVETTSGAYALRVSPSLRIHAEGCEALEAAWVTALRRDVGLATPAVMVARDGSPVVWASTDGVPEPRSCVLFEWVGGRPLRMRMNAGAVHRTGESAAIVHDHAAARRGTAAPVGALVADRVLYFRTESRLEELRPSYGSVLDESVSRAQQTLDLLWRNPPHPAHLLHGDIQPSNVMVAGSEVTLIDFQDLIWGFEIQEVVIALQGLASFDDCEALGRAFREGYEAIRPWPETNPETVAGLHAARRLNTLNLGLNVRKPGLDAWVARQVAPVIEWMTG
jgi:Ser/Thr protein kinase RdoA (MazF antagonist)